MIRKKTILGVLTKPRLLEFARMWELPGRSRKGVEELIELMAGAREIKPLDLLEALKVGELKDVCIERELPTSGKKADLVDRLAGVERKTGKNRSKKVSGTKDKSDLGRKAPGKKEKVKETKSYDHPEQTVAMRPEVGTQTSFKKKMPPTTYKYDSSLAPEMQWDEENPAREQGEALIRQILEAGSLDDAREAAGQLKNISAPFLNWAGKAERSNFTVPTLPLFVHERLSTQAIIETLKTHKRDKQMDIFDLFADPRHSIREQVMRAYEHQDQWVNRMILGDSLVVMNSLLRYESLGGQVQMIYMDPPYGVKFGSNFQPFVRKREVKHNDDEDMSREPEMVKAYRDTWELGLHTYLTYMRDRLLLCRELLHTSGSIFVQISDENLHHITEIMDEVFGADNRVSVISFKKTGFASSEGLSTTHDFVLWYARSKETMKFQPVFGPRPLTKEELGFYDHVELPDGSRRHLTDEEKNLGNHAREIGRVFARNPMVSPGWQDSLGYEVKFQGEVFTPPSNRHWATHEEGMNRLESENRLAIKGNTLRFVRYFDDFALQPLGTVWDDTGVGGFVGDPRLYVVQTERRVIERCLLMTSSPGDLVLDPTCGSGTTAYCAEQWGRRWITIDVSRVPLALARQRLLTATFPWYELLEEVRGPSSGFVYQRKQNKKGEEVGGIVPHITLKAIANDLPPDEEVLVDRPEQMSGITRVSGPFVFEATIPTPVDWEGDGEEDSGVAEGHADHVSRMLEVLRLSPVLHIGGGKTVKLYKVRPPAKTLNLSAEAVVDASTLKERPTLHDIIDEADEKRGVRLPLSERPVAIVFGPENGAVSEALVHNAAREASAKDYAHLYVIGFAIQPVARKYINDCEAITGIPAPYIKAKPELLMGDLLKTMRLSQMFSVCGVRAARIITLTEVGYA